MRIRPLYLALVSVVLVLFCAQSAYANLTLVVAADGKRLEEQVKWSTLGVYLGKYLKVRVRVKVVRSSAIGRCFESKCGDLFFTDPALFAEHRQEYGLIPLATRVNMQYGKAVSQMAAVIVAQTRREIYQIEDMKNTRFILAKSDYFLTRHAIWRLLLGKEVDPTEYLVNVKKTRNVESALRAVVDSAGHTGAVPSGYIELMLQQRQIESGSLRVIGQIVDEKTTFPYLRSTRLYPEWPLYSLPSVSKEDQKSVQKALYAMPRDSFVGRATKIAGWIPPLSYDDVTACLKEIGYGSYEKQSTEDRLKNIR